MVSRRRLILMLPAAAITYAGAALLWSWRRSPAGRDEGWLAGPAILDLGRVDYPSDLLRPRFRLQNVSGQPLKIVEVKTSCGCSGAAWSPDVVAPGEWLEVTLHVDWRGRAGLQSVNGVIMGDKGGARRPLRAVVVNGKLPELANVRPLAVRLSGGAGNARVLVVDSGDESRSDCVRSVEVSEPAIQVARIGPSGEPDPQLPLAGAPGRFAVWVTPGAELQDPKSASVAFTLMDRFERREVVSVRHFR